MFRRMFPFSLQSYVWYFWSISPCGRWRLLNKMAACISFNGVLYICIHIWTTHHTHCLKGMLSRRPWSSWHSCSLSRKKGNRNQFTDCRWWGLHFMYRFGSCINPGMSMGGSLLVYVVANRRYARGWLTLQHNIEVIVCSPDVFFPLFLFDIKDKTRCNCFRVTE